jgi:CheY-like chemotaxis protein
MLRRIIREDVQLLVRPHPLPLGTLADGNMLQQVLMNLVVNARDAMPQGGQITITTSEKTLTPAEMPNEDLPPGKYVCLSVSDTGEGIRPEILPRIFEPFFTTKSTGKGTGLGLATVFGIVNQHQGFIKVENQIGQGATFNIFLPATDQPLSPRAVSPQKTTPPGGNETILLVEDEPAVRKSLRLALVRHGYHVLEAEHGDQALEIWRDHHKEIALLLTDMVMPGTLNGHQLGQRLKAERAGLKVIYASGYNTEIAGREFQLQKGEAFIEKPVKVDELLAIIRRCLNTAG